MDELDKLKKLAESQRKEKAKIEGKLETLYESLVEEGYNSLDSAKDEMILLEKKINRMNKIFQDKLNEFKKTYDTELS